MLAFDRINGENFFFLLLSRFLFLRLCFGFAFEFVFEYELEGFKLIEDIFFSPFAFISHILPARPYLFVHLEIHLHKCIFGINPNSISTNPMQKLHIIVIRFVLNMCDAFLLPRMEIVKFQFGILYGAYTARMCCVSALLFQLNVHSKIASWLGCL